MHGNGGGIESLVPSGYRQAVRTAIDSDAGPEVDLWIAPFHAAAARRRSLRDQQRIAAGTCGLRPLQGVGRSKVHAPATLHGTVDRITCKPAITGEIEPSLALQIEAVAGIAIEAA
ncbi:MAG: hypothetical protein BWZ07_02604 [Alphaproteobacteria bacterium ADurb.BinA280]|nr:MAG: hypothetical protein BWZ07_02604 [Alphaproteobacteria bacterium ADurb.BinA280]